MEAKKKLYIASSLSELKDSYAKDVEYSKTQAYATYIHTSKRYHEAILAAEKDGDDERVYCLSMRYLSTYAMLKKHFPSKNAELKGDMPFVFEVLETCENVNNRLKKRYNDPKEFKDYQEKILETEVPKKVTEINNNDIKPHHQGKTCQNETGDIQSKKENLRDCLSVQEFYKLQKENYSLIVFDLREETEWNASKLNLRNQINIPESFLLARQVVTAKDVELCLDGDTLQLWLNRNSFETVVFCDWYGREETFVDGSKFNILRDTLIKWSPDQELKARPVILKGGFRDVAELYPMLVSNAKVNPPKLESAINDKLVLSKLTLKEEEGKINEIPKDQNVAQVPLRPTRPIVDRSKKPKDTPMSNGVAIQSIEESENSTTGTLLGVAYPSITDELSKPTILAVTQRSETIPSSMDKDDSLERTKPSKIPSIPNVDRSLKPRVKEETSENDQTGKSNETELSEVQKILEQLRIETDARNMLEEKARQLEKENEELMSRLSIKEAEPKVEEAETQSEKLATNMIKLDSLRAKKPLELVDDPTPKEINQEESTEHSQDDEPSSNRNSNTLSAVQPLKETPKPGAIGSAENNTYYQQLRDDAASALTYGRASEFKSTLKRTNSSPNLKNTEDSRKITDKSLPSSRRPPSPRRDTKPLKEIIKIDRSHLQSMQPVYGSTSNGRCGLRNLGNTCYMNACLQCLSHSFLLREYIIRGIFAGKIKPNNKEGMGGCIVSEFTVLLRALWNGNFKVVSPIDVKGAMSKYRKQFCGTNQQDAQEFLTALLDGLHEETNVVEEKRISRISDSDLANKSDEQLAKLFWDNYLLNNQSIIVDLFQGQYKSVVECLSCRKKSTSFDTFMYLSLPIPANSGKITLMDCLNLYCRPEVIEWNCPLCKMERKASKKLEIWKWPRYLIIHLKRFQFSASLDRVKIHTKVTYDHYLQNDNQWRVSYKIRARKELYM